MGGRRSLSFPPHPNITDSLSNILSNVSFFSFPFFISYSLFPFEKLQNNKKITFQNAFFRCCFFHWLRVYCFLRFCRKFSRVCSRYCSLTCCRLLSAFKAIPCTMASRTPLPMRSPKSKRLPTEPFQVQPLLRRTHHLPSPFLRTPLQA